MPESQTALSPDVQRLVDEGYAVTIQDQYIILDNIPYVSARNTISYAAIISAYQEKDGVAQVNGDHTVWFTGSAPCTPGGESLASALVADTNPATVGGRQAQCRLSYKSERPETLENFYNKLTHYVRKLHSYASVVDATVSATGRGSISIRQQRSVFLYPNSAIAREGLDGYEEKLRLAKVVIVGLGGTGSYILDALAKTPVEKIFLYDGDTIEPASAFRMPGALTIEQAHGGRPKTDYLRDLYSQMRTGIESRPVRVDDANINELDDANFVFIAIDHGPSRALISRHLDQRGVPFIDVGLGVDRVADEVKLLSRVRVTSIDRTSRALLDKLPIADDVDDAVYNNIQVAELNALNAMLAIITYKQRIGFYAAEIAVDDLRYVLAWQRLMHRNSDQP
jgi:hypothetical protein